MTSSGLVVGVQLYKTLLTHQQLDDWSVPRTHWAFPRITATEISWRRKVVERGSCVVDVKRRPISDTNSKACTPQAPEVSMAKGMKSTPATMSAYFRDLLSSAFTAAEPAFTLLSWIADWA